MMLVHTICFNLGTNLSNMATDFKSNISIDACFHVVPENITDYVFANINLMNRIKTIYLNVKVIYGRKKLFK